ncbi:MAG TPA: GDP-mannose 4,6-dehydratase [Promineifilum sp.]|nr:GDP-mannose 4,6-dehydratase [Promineifilum sp.]HRO88878.1 GDP-mannose 4,6-dehydratase [Promineifilum sp.]HRQ11879.1 GDP-mannose 4,6-dehydratase [Promineifilum sp.]
MEEAEVILLLLEEFGSGTPLPAPLDKLRPNLETVYADLRNYQLTARALRQARPDKVIHLAAVGVSDPFLNVNTALSHNVTGTLNLLRACFEADGMDVSQLVVARTPGERTAMNVYAASKAAAWSFCRMYARTAQWPIQGAMIFQAFGPHQPPHLLIPAALQAALAGEDFPMTTGEQEKDWIYIDDIVAGFQALLRAELLPGTTVELGTGRATRVADVVEELYGIVRHGGRPIIGAIPNRPGEAPRQIADAKQTAATINWRADLSLSEGLRKLVNSAT